MFDEKEKKLIKKYSLLPILSIAFLIMAIVIGFIWLIFMMLNDLVFYGGFYAIGLYAYLGIAAVYTLLFILCFSIPKLGMRKERWKKIVDKTKVKMENKDFSAQIAATMGSKAAGYILDRSDNETLNNAGDVFDAAALIGAVTTVSDISKEASRNAKKVAQVCDIELPKPRKYIISIVLFPILLLTLLYTPHFINSKQIMNTNKEVASQTIYALESSLNEDCAHISIDDPMEKYDKDGYEVVGYLYDYDAPQDSYISVGVGNDGLVYEVRYSVDVDLQASKEENLQRIESDLLKLNELLNQSNVSGLFSELFDSVVLPEDFQSQFMESSYYESIRYNMNDHVSFSYLTESEEDYDEFSISCIYIVID